MYLGEGKSSSLWNHEVYLSVKTERAKEKKKRPTVREREREKKSTGFGSGQVMMEKPREYENDDERLFKRRAENKKKTAQLSQCVMVFQRGCRARFFGHGQKEQNDPPLKSFGDCWTDRGLLTRRKKESSTDRLVDL